MEEVTGHAKGLNTSLGRTETLSRAVVKLLLVILILHNGLIKDQEDQEINEKAIAFVWI